MCVFSRIRKLLIIYILNKYKYKYIYIYLHFKVCIQVHAHTMHTPQCTYRSLKTPCICQLSPSITWILGIGLGLSGLVSKYFLPAEPSHWSYIFSVTKNGQNHTCFTFEMIPPADYCNRKPKPLVKNKGSDLHKHMLYCCIVSCEGVINGP